MPISGLDLEGLGLKQRFSFGTENELMVTTGGRVEIRDS